MDASEIRAQWLRDGFVIVPGLVSAEELSPALAALPDMFPTAEEFHNGVDPERTARFRDEFAGITDFPFAGTDVSLVSVHPKLIDLAEDLLGTNGVRVYSIEAWRSTPVLPTTTSTTTATISTIRKGAPW